jgi:molybdopterin-synthase adenylyltransferase
LIISLPFYTYKNIIAYLDWNWRNMKFKTSFVATAAKTKTEKILGVGTKQFLATDFVFDNSLQLLKFLAKPKSFDECITYMNKFEIPVNTFKLLLDHKLITSFSENFEKKDKMRFKNDLYLESITSSPDVVEKNIQKTTLIIIGCGGIGNFMSYGFQSLDPKQMILIDGDTIEASNLNRQMMFTEGDIGKKKTSVLARELKRRNSELNIKEVSKFANENILCKVIESIDDKTHVIGILSGDSSDILFSTTKVFAKYKIPFLNIGYLNDISVIGPFYIPDVSCCPLCHNSFAVENDGKKEIADETINWLNSRYEAPSSFTNNSLSSSLAMSDIIQFLDGNFDDIKSINNRVGIDNVSFEMYTITSSIDKNCKYCGV